MILQIFFTKMAITQARKVQIAKFWCLKSSTNIWLSCGNIYSIPKINKIEIEGKKGSKLAKIGQFFALKKLKLHFLKNFPGFDFTAFFWDTLYMSTNFSHWQNPCDTPDLVGSLHRHRELNMSISRCLSLMSTFTTWGHHQPSLREGITYRNII